MDYHDRIVIDPQIRFGKPIVLGTRITVNDVSGAYFEPEPVLDIR